MLALYFKLQLLLSYSCLISVTVTYCELLLLLVKVTLSSDAVKSDHCVSEQQSDVISMCDVTSRDGCVFFLVFFYVCGEIKFGDRMS